MDAAARAWLSKTARKNLWRVVPFYEYDDLLQDGYLHYCRIVQKYPNATDPPHIMRLFQITYLNHLHNLARARTRDGWLLQTDLFDDATSAPDDLWDMLIPPEEPDVEFNLRLKDAPEPVRQFFSTAFTEKGLRRWRARCRVFIGTNDARSATNEAPINAIVGRETLNQKLCRVAGLDPATCNLTGMLRQYLHSNTAGAGT